MSKKVIPIAHRILLKMDKIEIKKVGMIELPQETSKHLATYESGIIDKIGSTAFVEYLDEKKGDILPKVGDRVYIVKHAGIVVTENAGYATEKNPDMYRIVVDEDILAVEVSK